MDPSQPERPPAPLALLGLAGMLAAGAGLRVLGIVNTLPTAVGNMPLPDDAFYYLVLARNVALGRGWVISGSGEPTTGFQPLWGAVLAGVEVVSGGLTAHTRLLAAQGVGAAVGLSAALVLASLTWRLARGSTAAWIAAGAFLLSPQVVKHNLNGMETSLAILGGLILLWLFTQMDPSRLRPGRSVALGGVIGVCLLARVDLAILAGAGIAWWTLSPTFGRLRSRLMRLTLLGLGAVLVLLPWLWLAFGTAKNPIPESGSAVRLLTLLLRGLPPLGFVDSLVQAPADFGRLYLAFAVEFTSAWVRQVPLLLPLTLPVFALLDINLAESMSVGVGLAALAWMTVSVLRHGGRALRAVLGLWLAYAAGLTFAYSAVVLGPWFFQRYVAALAVGFHLLLLIALLRRLERLPKPGVGVAVVCAGIALAFVALVWRGSYRWIVAGAAAVPDDGFYRAARTIQGRLPPEARLGVFSAGLISYTLDRPVIALDGKVSRGARQAMAAGEMLAYLCRERVGYVADWDRMIERLLRRRTPNWDEGFLVPVEVIEVDDGNDILILQLDRSACGD